MAMSKERLLTVLDNLVKMDIGWLGELQNRPDSKRLHEINRDSKLAHFIAKELVRQYVASELNNLEGES